MAEKSVEFRQEREIYVRERRATDAGRARDGFAARQNGAGTIWMTVGNRSGWALGTGFG